MLPQHGSALKRRARENAAAAGSLPSVVARVATGPRATEAAFVPTVFRFLIVLAVLAGIAFAGMFALATLIEPQPREMTVTIPSSRLPAK